MTSFSTFLAARAAIGARAATDAARNSPYTNADGFIRRDCRASQIRAWMNATMAQVCLNYLPDAPADLRDEILRTAAREQAKAAQAYESVWDDLRVIIGAEDYRAELIAEKTEPLVWGTETEDYNEQT